ncbi:hypothetical protein DFH08DRAFT_828180 [Mycena albidolilacea]|uniref:Uncharacterized protein n=1 Tax=Mycena albidolilacea TaxID=1033008 RepID=A0AAD6YWJ9_9AGAR|nr:hypothetical protein DFH08DRAFT_828180 [Mycena albidolilacea]
MPLMWQLSGRFWSARCTLAKAAQITRNCHITGITALRCLTGCAGALGEHWMVFGTRRGSANGAEGPTRRRGVWAHVGKKNVRDRVARLNGRLGLPKKAIKRVAAIALSSVKAQPQKTHRHEDHDATASIQEPEPSAANKENENVFLEDTDPAAQYQSEFHQGSTPETPAAAPMAFALKGKLFTAKNPAHPSPHHDDDGVSTHTFPTPRPSSMLADSDNDNDLDSEIVPPKLDELCAADAGAFGGDGYPCPAPPETFVEKMAALGTKQALAAAPDITSAKAALMDIKLYTNPNSVTYGKWGISACQAAIAVGRDVYCVRRFANLSREYIGSRKVLPINLFGAWKQSMLADEDLATDVREYLQELGKFITADKLVDYLSREDVMEKHGLDKKIDVRTTRRYLNELGYRFKSEKKGQYSDGHEHDDVVYYREEVYLPALKGFQDRSCVFNADGSSWYHKDADTTPYKKDDGASSMVADYFSANFGWLHTRDGRPIARHAMRPGKNRDGYFSVADIEEQVIAACTTVNERWPEYNHVFIYDNATTHCKRSPGTLSARSMPKSISGTRSSGKKNKNPNPDPNFLVPVNKRNSDGSLMYDVHGTLLKENIQMTGKFKGKELLLKEQRKKGDLRDISEAELKKKNTEWWCKGVSKRILFQKGNVTVTSCGATNNPALASLEQAWRSRSYSGPEEAGVAAQLWSSKQKALIGASA